MTTTHPDIPAHAVLIGGGGHALVVAGVLASLNSTIDGIYDDDSAARACTLLGITYLGPIAAARSNNPPRANLHLAIGDVRTRRQLLLQLDGTAALTVISPDAAVSPRATIGPGVFVAPRAIVNAFAAIAPYAIINTGAIIEHECAIGENSHVAPGCVLGGNVRIGHDTLVGLGARVLPGVRIGSHCTVGAGAVVTRDIADNSTVVGIPARAR